MVRMPETIQQWKDDQIAFLNKILNHNYVSLDGDDLMIDYSGDALKLTKQEEFMVVLHRRGW